MQGHGQRFLFPFGSISRTQLFLFPQRAPPFSLPRPARARDRLLQRKPSPHPIPPDAARAKRQGNKKGTRAYLRKLGCVGFWLAGAADVVEEEAAGEAVLSARVDPGVGSGVIFGGGGAGRG